MRRSLSLFVLAAVVLGTLQGEEKAPVLFNGKDLTGWRVWLKDDKAKPEDCFTVKGGVIACSGKPNGYLITEKEYGDYVLEVEWKWGDEAKKLKTPNSGVLLHASGPDMTWPRSIEAQLKRGYVGEFWLTGGFKLTVDPDRQDKKIERRFLTLKADSPVEKPLGEWNKYEITCRGDAVELKVNGVKLNEGTKSERTKGKIAFQSEGAPISFRNIKLTPIR